MSYIDSYKIFLNFIQAKQPDKHKPAYKGCEKFQKLVVTTQP